MLDLTQLKKREQHVQAVLKSLPDPVPKSKVLETFAEIDPIRTGRIKSNTARVYDPDKTEFRPSRDRPRPQESTIDLGEIALAGLVGGLEADADTMRGDPR